MSTPHYSEISVFHTLPQPRLHLADIAQHASSEPMTASRIRGARFASWAAKKSASRQISEIAPAQNRAVEVAACCPERSRRVGSVRFGVREPSSRLRGGSACSHLSSSVHPLTAKAEAQPAHSNIARPPAQPAFPGSCSQFAAIGYLLSSPDHGSLITAI